MGASNGPHWRTSQKELHILNGKVSALIADDARRKLWLDFLAEYPIAIKTGVAARDEWNQRECQYFEREIFAPGNKSLRDRTIVPADLYPGDYARKLSAAEFAAIPSGMRKAVYQDWEPNGKGGYRRKAYKCFHPFIKGGKETGGGSLYIAAWIPEELICFNQALLCHAPLPPDNIGRDYSLPEICYGLTVLHDVDGSFGRIVPLDSQLYADLGHHFALTFGSRGQRATDAWVPSLELLLSRVEAKLARPVTPVSAKSASKRGAKAKYDPTADTKLKNDWDAAKACGAYKADFAKGKSKSLADLEKVLARVRKRKSVAH